VAQERHFLAVRDKDGLLEVKIFRNQDVALKVYAEEEKRLQRIGFWDDSEEVCLFGSDSLATLCRTHASWFAPETIPDSLGLKELRQEERKEEWDADHAQHDADDPG
jgi:hypothetical protein